MKDSSVNFSNNLLSLPQEIKLKELYIRCYFRDHTLRLTHTSSRFLTHEGQNTLCSHCILELESGRPKGKGFLRPISSKITLTKKKQRKIERTRRKKEDSQKQNSNGCTLILLFRLGLKGAETNCGIAGILGILLMDSYDIEDITWPRGDTKFLIECWKIFHEWAQWTSEIFFQHGKIPNNFTLIVFWYGRRDLLCSHIKGNIFTCEDNMLFSHVKIPSFRANAHLVFHWCLYNKYRYFDSSNNNLLFVPFELEMNIIFGREKLLEGSKRSFWQSMYSKIRLDIKYAMSSFERLI